MHVRSVNDLDAMATGDKVLHGENFVCGEGAQDMGEAQRFGVVALQCVVAQQLLNGGYSLFGGKFAVYVQPKR